MRRSLEDTELRTRCGADEAEPVAFASPTGKERPVPHSRSVRQAIGRRRIGKLGILDVRGGRLEALDDKHLVCVFGGGLVGGGEVVDDEKHVVLEPVDRMDVVVVAFGQRARSFHRRSFRLAVWRKEGEPALLVAEHELLAFGTPTGGGIGAGEPHGFLFCVDVEEGDGG